MLDNSDAIGVPSQPAEAPAEERQLQEKQRLAASFRIFARRGFDEGAAGHITVRDPVAPDTFWVNPFGLHFSKIRVFPPPKEGQKRVVNSIFSKKPV